MVLMTFSLKVKSQVWDSDLAMRFRATSLDSGGHQDERAHYQERLELQGYLAHKKQPPPKDHHRALGIGLL